MSLADVKASLASTYASGATPRLLAVLPDGKEEMWELGPHCVVVPVVPPDASAPLEYALRLRRDALFSGLCEGCGASPHTKVLAEIDQRPLVSQAFPHKATCPGSDKSTKRLLEQHWQTRKGSTADVALQGASQSAREWLLERVGTNGISMREAEGKPIAEGFLDKLLTASSPRCPHLISNPAQIWYVLIAEGAWRCRQCCAYFAEKIRQGYRLPHIEDHTCDLCRRYAPRTIEPLMIRIGPFIMHGGTCARCTKLFATTDERTDTIQPDGTNEASNV